MRSTILCFQLGIAVVCGFGTTPFFGSNTLPKRKTHGEELKEQREKFKSCWGEEVTTKGPLDVATAFTFTRKTDEQCTKGQIQFDLAPEELTGPTYAKWRSCWDDTYQWATEKRANYRAKDGREIPEDMKPLDHYRPRLSYDKDNTMEQDELWKTCHEKCGPCSIPEDRGLNRTTMGDNELRRDAIKHCSPCRRFANKKGKPDPLRKELEFTGGRTGKTRMYCGCKRDPPKAKEWAKTAFPEDPNAEDYWNFAPALAFSKPKEKTAHFCKNKGRWKKNHCPKCMQGDECPAYCRTALETEIGCPPVATPTKSGENSPVWPYLKHK